jgi:hypothetical protein
LLLAESLDYLQPNCVAAILEKCSEERKMLSGLRRTLKAKIQP